MGVYRLEYLSPINQFHYPHTRGGEASEEQTRVQEETLMIEKGALFEKLMIE